MLKISFLLICTLGFFLVFLSSCGPVATPVPWPNLHETAAVQATEMIEQAEATSLLLKAQAQSTAMVQNAAFAPHPVVRLTPVPASTSALDELEATASATSDIYAGEDGSPIEITDVSFAGEGAYIIVQFFAPPKITHTWLQGNVSVIDETTGTVYNEIPVAPVIGPLIARPKQYGRLGYVMLVNAPTPLRAGAQVSVVLGDYRHEHLTLH
jgi:hypothetical protein